MSLLAFYLILIAVVLVAVAVFNPPLRCLLHAISFVLCRLTEFYPIRALLLTQIDNLF